MTRSRRTMLPATSLGRTRLAGLILGCMTVAPQLGQVRGPAVGPVMAAAELTTWRADRALLQRA